MKCVTAKGNFHDTGVLIGKATKDEIRFQQVRLIPQLLEKGFGGDELSMLREARAQHELTRDFWPEAGEFLEGMALGAGMKLFDLLPIAYCEEIAIGPSVDALREKCSTVVVRSSDGWVLGHQEDYLPSFYGKLVVYDLRIDGYPRMVSLNYPGTFPGVAGSLNVAGVATSNNSLWPATQRGIAKQAKHFRATLEDTVLGALGWLVFSPHALTDHYTVIGGDEDIALSVEVTSHPDASRHCEVREIVFDRVGDDDIATEAPFWHANHVRWLEPWASGIVPDPANHSSAMRGRELRRICHEGAPRSAQELESLLCTSDGILNRRDGNDLTGASFTVTLASIIIEPSRRKISFVGYDKEKSAKRVFSF